MPEPIKFILPEFVSYLVDRGVLCGKLVGTASVSFARGQHLTSATDDAEPRGSPHTHLRSTQGAGRTCRPPAPRSSSHEAVAAFNIPTFHYHPRQCTAKLKL